jgi:hypothetical protein
LPEVRTKEVKPMPELATKLAKPLAAPNRLKPPEMYSISFSVNSFIAIPCIEYFQNGRKPEAKGSTVELNGASDVRYGSFFLFIEAVATKTVGRGGKYELRKERHKRKSPVKTGLYIILER